MTTDGARQGAGPAGGTEVPEAGAPGTTGSASPALMPWPPSPASEEALPWEGIEAEVEAEVEPVVAGQAGGDTPPTAAGASREAVAGVREVVTLDPIRPGAPAPAPQDASADSPFDPFAWAQAFERQDASRPVADAGGHGAAAQGIGLASQRSESGTTGASAGSTRVDGGALAARGPAQGGPATPPSAMGRSGRSGSSHAGNGLDLFADHGDAGSGVPVSRPLPGTTSGGHDGRVPDTGRIGTEGDLATIFKATTSEASPAGSSRRTASADRVEVRIGTIELTVRAPAPAPSPAPAPRPAPPPAVRAASGRAPLEGLGFSASRHHLRWS